MMRLIFLKNLDLGATTRYRHCLNITAECAALYFYEPDVLGAFVSLLISEINDSSYVSQKL